MIINNVIQNDNQVVQQQQAGQEQQATQQQTAEQQQTATQQQTAAQQQAAVQEQAAEPGLSAEERRQRRAERQARREQDNDREFQLRDRLRAARGELQETRRRLREAQLRADDEVLRREDDRIIVRREGQIIILRQENEFRFGEEEEVEQLPTGDTRTIVVRGAGVRIATVRNEQGEIIRRSRILPDGRETVLIDAGQAARAEARVDVQVNLPPIRVEIPREEYVVETEQATEEEVVTALAAPPVEQVERVYTLEEVRQNERVRAKVRRVDLDTITFDFGSAVIPEDELITLEKVGVALEDILFERPDEVFLIEGHTDAVGSEIANLELSDRRAEAVAIALAENFDVPPENLVTQGYGEEDLKIPTDAPERENRRVTLRNISPLVNAAEAQPQ